MPELPGSREQVVPNSKVGLSLSFCVSDILRGGVKEEEVKEIIAATDARSPQEWSKVIGGYKNTYWSENPDEGEAIARRLLAAGKIRQPRTEGKEAHSIVEGHWVDADKADEEYRKRTGFA